MQCIQIVKVLMFYASTPQRVICYATRSIFYDNERLNKFHQMHHELTIRIANLALIFEPSSHSNAKNHKDPINIWNIYLAKKLLWCMYNFDSWKTAKSKGLFDYRKSCRYGRLTRNNSSCSCNNKHWPVYAVCSKRNHHNCKIIAIYPIKRLVNHSDRIFKKILIKHNQPFHLS